MKAWAAAVTWRARIVDMFELEIVGLIEIVHRMLDLELHLTFAVRSKHYMCIPLSLLLISMSSRFWAEGGFLRPRRSYHATEKLRIVGYTNLKMLSRSYHESTSDSENYLQRFRRQSRVVPCASFLALRACQQTYSRQTRTRIRKLLDQLNVSHCAVEESPSQARVKGWLWE